jgi:hypothetical protein
MILFLTVALLLCSVIIIILGAQLIIRNRLEPKIVGITILLIVCDICLVFVTLYLLVANLYKVLGID